MNPQDKVLIVFSTCPTPEVAATLAHHLVTEGLAACVNQLPGVRSTYIWQGEVQSDLEVLLVIKTTETGFAALEKRLLSLHPYELPEVVAIPVCAGTEKYLDWVRDTVK